MYIELFLLDNLLLNLLIVRLAAATLSVRPPLFRQIGCAAASALVAALAAYRLPWLGSPVLRVPLLAVMALAIPAKSWRGWLLAACATLFATFTVGGCALAAAYISGGGAEGGIIRGGISIRAAILSAAAASFLPSASRRLLRRRLRNETTARIVILHGGLIRRFTAVVDTGDLLREPVSGLPVAVLHCRALERYAKLPVPAETAAGRTVLFGFVPEHISVNGTEVCCVVALTRERLPADAVIPPDICVDLK